LSQNDIDQMVDSFSTLIQSTFNPYFNHYLDCNVYSNCNKEWYDNECRFSRQEYQQALSFFFLNKTLSNRELLCNAKCKYKSLIREKKRIFKLREIEKYEPLKKTQHGKIENVAGLV
jgi:hypothetical protein